MEPPGHPTCCPHYASGQGRWARGVYWTQVGVSLLETVMGDLIPIPFRVKLARSLPYPFELSLFSLELEEQTGVCASLRCLFSRSLLKGQC